MRWLESIFYFFGIILHVKKVRKRDSATKQRDGDKWNECQEKTNKAIKNS